MEIKITFGFSLYTVSLCVTQVTYFGRGLNELRELRLLEGVKVCCY